MVGFPHLCAFSGGQSSVKMRILWLFTRKHYDSYDGWLIRIAIYIMWKTICWSHQIPQIYIYTVRDLETNGSDPILNQGVRGILDITGKSLESLVTRYVNVCVSVPVDQTSSFACCLLILMATTNLDQHEARNVLVVLILEPSNLGIPKYKLSQLYSTRVC